MPSEDSSSIPAPDFFAMNQFIRNRNGVGPCQHDNLLIVWYDSNDKHTEMNKSAKGRCFGCWMLIPSPPIVLPWPGPKKWHPLAKGLIKNREKDRARYKFVVAKRAGRIIRKPCEVCGDPKSEAHHPDYSKPLYVIWLCKSHHVKADAYRRMAEKIQRLEKLLGLAAKA